MEIDGQICEDCKEKLVLLLDVLVLGEELLVLSLEKLETHALFIKLSH